MKRLNYDLIIKYQLKAVCDSTLHIGSSLGGKEEVLVHPTDSRPFIQASSIAGAMRDYCNKNLDMTEYIFGSSGKEDDSLCRIKVSDGRFNLDTVKLERRPHVKINRKTGAGYKDGKFGAKFDIEYIGAGAEFSYDVYLYVDSERKDITDIFEKVLAGMKNGDISFGGVKSSGSGMVKLISAFKTEYDLTSEEGRKNYAADSCESGVDIYGDLSIEKSGTYAYQISLKGETHGPIQIRGIAEDKFGAGNPDSSNIVNAKGDYIIPGSSVRGVIRSQMEKIVKHFGDMDIIEAAYGKTGEGTEAGKRGNIIFYDAVIGEKTHNANIKLRHRIHIDRLTGSVMNGALLSEKNATGHVEIKINILEDDNKNYSLALLILAMRDIALGTVGFGNGYATGKGFIDVESITINDAVNNKDVELKLNDLKTSKEIFSISGDEDIIDTAFNAIKEVGR